MTSNCLVGALQRHLELLSRRLGRLRQPVHAYVAGGIAVNYHTGHRMSDDADIKWSHRVPIPPDLQIFEVADPEDPSDCRIVTMDSGFSDVLGSFPPDWERDAIEIGTAGDIVVHVMNPVDLAVSKIARFQDRDREDIRQLAARGLIDPDPFASRAKEALEYYVGDTTFIEINLGEALEIVRGEIDDPQPK